MNIRRMFLLLILAVLMVSGVSGASAAADDGTIRSWNAEEKWQYIQFGQYMYEKDGTMACLSCKNDIILLKILIIV